MFRVAICDNEELICSHIENIIWKYCKKVKDNIDIDIFTSGERLIAELSNGTDYDMLFLDIELDTESGIDVGSRIRNEIKNDKIMIVYISGNETYAMKLFEVRPLNFLIKPLINDKILEVYEKAKELSYKLDNVFVYKNNRKSHKKSIKDIIYFESMDRQIRMVCTDGDIIFYGSLKEIMEQIGKYNFISCHKSYLINYSHVAEFQYEMLVMSNQESIPISQPQRKYVRDYQIKYERIII